MVQHVVDAVSVGSLDAMLALGVALVFGVMHLVNFAYGELVMVGGYTIFVTAGLPWPLIVVITVGVVAVAALLMERAAFRPVRGASPTTLLVTSFAVSILLQSLAAIGWGRRAKGVDFGSRLAEPITIGGKSIALVDVVSIAVALVLAVGLAVFLKRTWVGVAMRGAAENFVMARLLGVSANMIIAVAFALSGVLAAASALLLVASTGTVSPTMGLQPVLIGFVATVIGGIGSLIGAALGGFLLGVVTVTLQIVLPDSSRGYRDAFVFGVVILILLVRPGGLISSKALEERV
jgi:branched-chain amino acid transport system permease protein